MGMLSPLTGLVGGILDRVLRRSDYAWIWDWQARSLQNADLAVAGAVGPAEWLRSGEATSGRIGELTRLSPSDEVLEIGCGSARVGVHMAPRCRRWVGADVSHRMLAHARRRLEGAANVKLVRIDGSSLAPVGDASVDLVYCTAVFMHIDEWDRFGYVEEAMRVLRPGGRLYVDNLNLTGEMGWTVFRDLRRLGPRRRPPQASRCSTPQELETYLSRAGFTGITVESEPLFVWAVGEKARGR